MDDMQFYVLINNICHIQMTRLITKVWDGTLFNRTALKTAKTLWSFGRSECNRVKIEKISAPRNQIGLQDQQARAQPTTRVHLNL